MFPDLPPPVFTSEQEATSDPIAAALDWAAHLSDVAERTEAALLASRSARREPPQPTDVAPTVGDLPALLITIRANESGGNYPP